MKIYKCEKKDNLELAISNYNVVVANSLLTPSTDNVTQLSLNFDKANITVNDLFPAKNIYVTLGWNKNDDIFDKHETWAARKTVSNKPFNLHHKPRQIIGHVIDSFGYTFDDELIPDDIVEDELPDQFNLITQSVIYKSVDQRDEELKQERAQLIEEILAGSWYVSMECLFDNFDYGFKSENGENTVVQRNESTAFLTKHLRAYGGKGTYGNAKLGRIIRDLAFIGNGLVKNPANPNSIFLFGKGNVNPFIGEFIDDKKQINFVLNTYTEGDSFMSDNIDRSNEYKEKISDLEKDLANAQKRLRDMDEQVVCSKLEAKDTEIAVKGTEVDNIKVKLDEMTASYNDSEKSRKEIEQSLSDMKTKFGQMVASLDSMEVEAKKVNRVSMLIDEGVDKSESENVVAKFISLDDEKFVEIVAMYKRIVDKSNESVSEDSTIPKSNENDEEGSEGIAEGSLDNLEEESNDADLSSASDDENEEHTNKMQALALDVSKYIRGGKSSTEK